MATRDSAYSPAYGYRVEVPKHRQKTMTVCIGAICNLGDDPRIILCSDMKVSGALGSAEIMLKNRVVHMSSRAPWHALTAGTDTDIAALVSLMRASFRSGGIVDETNVVSIVSNALHAGKRQRVEQLVQSKFALSYDEFLRVGKSQLPDEAFRLLTTEIEMTVLDAELIVAGFESDTFPVLVKAHSKDGALIKEEFACIGEGAYLAQASLMSRSYSETMDFNMALYIVYEAKRFAEGAPTVGRATSIAIVRQDGQVDSITPEGIATLAAYYGRFGRKAPAEVTFNAGDFKVFRNAK